MPDVAAATHLTCDPPAGRVIVPDYALPDAVCIPYWRFDIRETLEELARLAATRTGVILIGPDPLAAQEFATSTGMADHFGIVAGAYDSPWMRDHAPIALRDGEALWWIRPKRPDFAERKLDPELFHQIMPRARGPTDLNIAGGNLVAGPNGLTISTHALLAENPQAKDADFRAAGAQLGITDWLFVPPFADDISAHTDSMIRFLRPDLCAIARRVDDPAAAQVSETLHAAIAFNQPEMKTLMLPVTARQGAFTSPLNWIQLDDLLIIPDFGVDPNADLRQVLLENQGFRVETVPCPTTGLGGALHCITASVFAE